MTDRLNGCWVAFDRDIRTDDAKEVLQAIRMVKGVASVFANVSDSGDWLARQRVRSELAKEMGKFFERIFGGPET